MSDPRILAIMGSGETAPTMAKVHRALFARLGEGPVPACIIDTPYGFQENADELSARTVEFYGTSVGRDVAVASCRSRDVDDLTLATAVARLREARYVMAGPGSPSYALRHWAGGPIPLAIADKLAGGGIVTMASAAALTLGALTIPVYEIYKVGEDPHWLPGLDLLAPATGLHAAVLPHYDNAEGGTHDTRFCYMGERRLRMLEQDLPNGTFILGVDSHTALVLDLDRGTASVSGLGGITIRVNGRSGIVPSGSEVPIGRLEDVARALAEGTGVDLVAGGVAGAAGGTAGLEPGRQAGAGASSADRPGGPTQRATSNPDRMAHLEGTFSDALHDGDTRAAVGALLELDLWISSRIRAGEDSPDLDNAAGTFRSLIARLGERADRAVSDPRETLEPFVTTLLDLRARARSDRDWETADLIRERLVAGGVEVRDEAGGSSWDVHDAAPQPVQGGSSRHQPS